MAMRARIVLHCEQGVSNSGGGLKLHITGATVGKWRERFREFGLDGLLDEPRVGAPRKISDEQIEEVVTKTLEAMAPKGPRDGLVTERHRAHLACFRITAASRGELQVFQGSAVRGEGAGHCGLVSESAGSRDRALRRRKQPS